MTLSGIFARFSAQSVSMIPVGRDSTLIKKPLSSQKSLITGHNASGSASIEIQRWLPARLKLIFSCLGNTGVGPAATRVLWPSAYSEAVAEPALGSGML